MKIWSYILSFLAFLFPCAKDKLVIQPEHFCEIKIDDPIATGYLYGYSLQESMSSTFIYKNGQYYIVTVAGDSGQVVKGIFVFSQNKKLLYSNGMIAIKDENIEHFIGKPFQTIKKQYGDVHCNIGSGPYIPAYVTENATIVGFRGDLYKNDNNPVQNIFKFNIIK